MLEPDHAAVHSMISALMPQIYARPSFYDDIDNGLEPHCRGEVFALGG